MSIHTQTNKVQYVGNGVTTKFPGNFPVIEAFHVRVFIPTITGGDEELTKGFQVILEPNGTCSVLFAVAPADGQEFTIVRKVPLTQPLDLENGGDFNAEEIEANFDRLVMQIQDAYEMADRAFSMAITFSGETPTAGEYLDEIMRLRDEAAAARDRAEQCRTDACQCADDALNTLNQAVTVIDGATQTGLGKLDAATQTGVGTLNQKTLDGSAIVGNAAQQGIQDVQTAGGIEIQKAKQEADRSCSCADTSCQCAADAKTEADRIAGLVRASLTAHTTFYVRTDGNDSNDGLADSPQRALRTVDGAFALLNNVDPRGYEARLSFGPGNHGVFNLHSTRVPGFSNLRMGSTDPNNPATFSYIRNASVSCFLYITSNVNIEGVGTTQLLIADLGGFIDVQAATTIRFSGVGDTALYANQGSFITVNGYAVMDGFTAGSGGQTVRASQGGIVRFQALDRISGTATGRRWFVGEGGRIISPTSSSAVNPQSILEVIPGSTLPVVQENFLAKLGMPSSRVMNFTLPESGGTFTAPSDGWISISMVSGISTAYLALNIQGSGDGVSSFANATNNYLNLFFPIQKEMTVVIRYTATGTVSSCKFIYAEGAH